MATLKNTTIDDAGFLQLPTGSTGQRPVTAQTGQMRFNTDTQSVEWYDSVYSSWFPADFVPPVATGGTITNITEGDANYRVHSFTTVGNSTFTVTRSGPIEFLIVAGGGSGGNNKNGSYENGGGGGAGGMLQGMTTVTPQTYTITVGAGGVIPGANGQTKGDNSSAFALTAFGGGGGITRDSQANVDGASGGGACNWSPNERRGSGSLGQGNPGGTASDTPTTDGGAAGGGGAGSSGRSVISVNDNNGADGGEGIVSKITGTPVAYASGGGGGGGSAGGLGGTGGGGNAGSASSINGASATPNTGGGGGGNFATVGNAGNGGSGIVIVRYRTG